MTAPTLQRPMLFVHGYCGWADQGRPLCEYLASNPENRVGGTFRSGQEDEFRQSVRSAPESAVYTIALSNPRASYTEVAGELTEAVAILNQETGLEVDVVAHSMGGLVTREHLDRGHDGINSVFFLGTPQHGVPFNPVTAAAATLYSPVLGNAPRSLLADSALLTSGHNSHLAELNERWPEQLDKLDKAYSIVGTRLPTATSAFPFVGRGDGVVSTRSAELDGTERVAVSELDPFSLPIADNHLSLVSNPKVLAFIADAVT